LCIVCVCCYFYNTNIVTSITFHYVVENVVKAKGRGKLKNRGKEDGKNYEGS